jgi:hypothetical protein
MRIERLIWLSKDGQRELVTLDLPSGKIAVCAFEVSPDELGEVMLACQDCATQLPVGSHPAPSALQPVTPLEVANGSRA